APPSPVARRLDDMGRAPRRRTPPLRDALARRTEHGVAVAAILGEPQAVLLVHPAAARSRARQRRAPDFHLAGLCVAPADARAAEFQLVGVVVLVGWHAVGAGLVARRIICVAEALLSAGVWVGRVGDKVLLAVDV